MKNFTRKIVEYLRKHKHDKLRWLVGLHNITPSAIFKDIINPEIEYPFK